MRYLTKENLSLLNKYSCSTEPKLEDILRLVNMLESQSKDIDVLSRKLSAYMYDL